MNEERVRLVITSIRLLRALRSAYHNAFSGLQAVRDAQERAHASLSELHRAAREDEAAHFGGVPLEAAVAIIVELEHAAAAVTEGGLRLESEAASIQLGPRASDTPESLLWECFRSSVGNLSTCYAGLERYVAILADAGD